MTSYEEATAALDARTNYERSGRLTSPTLERITAVMDVMAHPERTYPTLHVTGTNGKSTAAHAATEVLRAAGLRVGTYVSPHVETVRERFSYDGTPISKHDFAAAWDELAPFLELVDSKSERPLTWFEASTALALSWFAERAVDAAVVEVGMGGSWDATNVVDAGVCLFTTIGLDHAQVLGPGLADIAREKAGIIKPGAAALSLEQEPEVTAVLRARAAEVGADLREEGGLFALEEARLALGGQQLAFRIGHERFTDVFLPAFGWPAACAAVCAAAAARALLGDRPLGHEVIAEAFGRVALPGRVEVVRRRPLIVLDGAHNPDAAVALVETMSDSFAWDKLWLVVSVMDDKDVAGVVGPLAGMADEVIATRNTSPRAADPERVAAIARAAGRYPMIVQNVADAVSVALERVEESDAILVAGSLYTVGEARPMLAPSHPEEPR